MSADVGGAPATLLRRSLVRTVRRGARQYVTVATVIAIGALVFVAALGAGRDLQESYDALHDELRFPHVFAVGGDVERSAAALRTAGADEVATRTVVDLPMEPVDDIRFVGRVVGMDLAGGADGQPAVARVDVIDGAALTPGTRGEVLVDQSMADAHGLAPGDAMTVIAGGRELRLRVAGVAASSEYLWPARSQDEVFTLPDTFGVVYADEPLARDLARAVAGGSAPTGGTSGREAIAWFGNGAGDPDEIEAAQQAALDAGAGGVFGRDEQPSDAALSADIAGFAGMAIAFPVLFFLAAALSTWILLTRLVSRDRRRIATLRAMGMPRGVIVRQNVLLGAVLGVVGAVPGALIGLALAGATTRAYAGELSLPQVTTTVHLDAIVGAIVVAVLVGALAALGPARRAASILPADAMRSSVPTRGAGISLLERVVPRVRRLPLHWRISMRGVGRAPVRSLYVAGSSVLALVLVLASWGMVDSMSIMLERQFADLNRYDMEVTPAGDAEAVAAATAALDDVEVVEIAARGAVVVASLDEDARTLQLEAWDPASDLRGFTDTSGDAARLPAAGIAIGTPVADDLGLEVGDPVAVAIAGGGVASRQLEVSLIVDEPLGTSAYVSTAQLDALSAGAGPGAQVAPLIVGALREGAAVDEVLRDVRRVPGVAVATDARAVERLVRDYQGLFYVFIGSMLLLGGLLAMAVVYNAMTVVVAERLPELAMLRADGLGARRLSRSVGAENLILAALGIPVGLVLGWLASRAMLSAFDSDLFRFPLEFRWYTMPLAAIGVMLAIALAQIPALRQVRNIDVPSALRERDT